jgi:hypothetical protein
MPVIAIITCIFIGYFIKPKVIIEEAGIENKPFTSKMFTVVIKYIAPVCLAVILFSSVVQTFGIHVPIINPINDDKATEEVITDKLVEDESDLDNVTVESET